MHGDDVGCTRGPSLDGGLGGISIGRLVYLMLNDVSTHTQIYRLLPQQRVTAVQAVRRQEDGTVTAASDPRKYGLAAAF